MFAVLQGTVDKSEQENLAKQERQTNLSDMKSNYTAVKWWRTGTAVTCHYHISLIAF